MIYGSFIHFVPTEQVKSAVPGMSPIGRIILNQDNDGRRSGVNGWVLVLAVVDNVIMHFMQQANKEATWILDGLGSGVQILFASVDQYLGRHFTPGVSTHSVGKSKQCAFDAIHPYAAILIGFPISCQAVLCHSSWGRGQLRTHTARLATKLPPVESFVPFGRPVSLVSASSMVPAFCGRSSGSTSIDQSMISSRYRGYRFLNRSAIGFIVSLACRSIADGGGLPSIHARMVAPIA